MNKFNFNDMDSTLTLWENTKAFFDIPVSEPFIVYLDLNEQFIRELDNIYNSINDIDFVDWKSSSQYQGICLNKNSLLPFENQYSTEFYSVDKRLSYSSTLSFNEFTSLGGDINRLFHPFNIVRSKIARLHGDEPYTGAWHSDEDVREVLKIIIPLRSNSDFKFQIQGKPPFELMQGQALSFDATIPHRVISTSNIPFHRDYMIANIPIWFTINGCGTDISIEKSKYFNTSPIHSFYQNTNIFK